MEQTPSPQSESAEAAAGFCHTAVFFPFFVPEVEARKGWGKGGERVGMRAGTSSQLLKVT